MERNSDLLILGSALRDLTRDLMRTGRRVAGVAPLPETEVDIIKLVVHRPGMSPGRLAAELRIKPSNISAALRRLAAAGLVMRETDPADRRATRVLPTAQAIRNVHGVERARAALLDQALAALPAADRAAVLAAIPSLQALQAAVRELA
ncbi:MarR family transcriptional regulator [Spongiactinospora gelatinilytica]|uniref:MarR family transcriptional regulator n=1 Tax=Spongiactinospora gelatinilytica TaxID=2666298 RepID=A0A2W2HX83_9ACTN|nr:MarR family transcriptional regulator [Spongiactinospora gelatinilytica]PZG50587.1 MarR family transcriptional regulator [Spongiactinospora gelatinilytica]